MTNRWISDDQELENYLSTLETGELFPPTPDLGGAVRERIQLRSHQKSGWFHSLLSSTRHHPGWAAAAVLTVTLVAALGAFTPVPGAIADRLGVSGIEITTGDDWDDLELTPVADSGLELGQPMELEDARDLAPFDIRVPATADTGPPDNAYVGQIGEVPIVSLTWEPREGLDQAGISGVGLLVTQFPAELADEPFVTKGMEEPNFANEVVVNESRGYWLQGRHTFRFTTGRDEGGSEQVRLAGNVLLWEEDGYVFRIEGSLSLAFEDAIAIAESMTEE